MKTVLGVVLALGCAAPVAMAQSRPEAPVRTTPFPDVPKTHWAYDAVEQLRKVGIVRGYPPQGTFQPAPEHRAPAAQRSRSRKR